MKNVLNCIKTKHSAYHHDECKWYEGIAKNVLYVISEVIGFFFLSYCFVCIHILRTKKQTWQRKHNIKAKFIKVLEDIFKKLYSSQQEEWLT